MEEVLDLLAGWYFWGWLAALVVAVAIAASIFFDSQRRKQEASAWRILSVFGALMILPSPIVRLFHLPRFLEAGINCFDPLFFDQCGGRDALLLCGVLGLLGAILGIVAAFGYLVAIQRARAHEPLPPPGPKVKYTPPFAQRTVRDEPAEVTRTEVMEEPERAMAWLAVKSGATSGKQLGLTMGRSLVGRDVTRCDIVLDDGAVSAEHACIQYENGLFVIYDLASSNGTFVNRQQVHKHTLMDGDEIRLGKTLLVFREAEA